MEISKSEHSNIEKKLIDQETYSNETINEMQMMLLNAINFRFIKNMGNIFCYNLQKDQLFGGNSTQNTSDYYIYDECFKKYYNNVKFDDRNVLIEKLDQIEGFLVNYNAGKLKEKKHIFAKYDPNGKDDITITNSVHRSFFTHNFKSMDDVLVYLKKKIKQLKHMVLYISEYELKKLQMCCLFGVFINDKDITIILDEYIGYTQIECTDEYFKTPVITIKKPLQLPKKNNAEQEFYETIHFHPNNYEAFINNKKKDFINELLSRTVVRNNFNNFISLNDIYCNYELPHALSNNPELNEGTLMSYCYDNKKYNRINGTLNIIREYNDVNKYSTLFFNKKAKKCKKCLKQIYIIIDTTKLNENLCDYHKNKQCCHKCVACFVNFFYFQIDKRCLLDINVSECCCGIYNCETCKNNIFNINKINYKDVIKYNCCNSIECNSNNNPFDYICKCKNHVNCDDCNKIEKTYFANILYENKDAIKFDDLLLIDTVISTRMKINDIKHINVLLFFVQILSKNHVNIR